MQVEGAAQSPGETRDGHVSRRRVVRAAPLLAEGRHSREIARVGDVLLRVVAPIDGYVNADGDDCEESEDRNGADDCPARRTVVAPRAAGET